MTRRREPFEWARANFLRAAFGRCGQARLQGGGIWFWTNLELKNLEGGGSQGLDRRQLRERRRWEAKSASQLRARAFLFLGFCLGLEGRTEPIPMILQPMAGLSRAAPNLHHFHGKHLSMGA